LKYVFSYCTLSNEVAIIEGKLKENDLNGIGIHFELAVIQDKITVNAWSESSGNQFWFELARASSYRAFELPGVNCINMVYYTITEDNACTVIGQYPLIIMPVNHMENEVII